MDSTVLLFKTYTIQNAQGTLVTGSDFEPGLRIAESYAKAAKMLMKEIKKKLKKIRNEYSVTLIASL